MSSTTNQPSFNDITLNNFSHEKFNLRQENNFVFIFFHSNIYLEESDTQDMYDILIKIHKKENKKLNLLLDVNGIIGTNKASRDLGVSLMAINLTNSLSLITKSTISKLMANFFIKVTPPPYKVRVVNSKEKGIKWLNKQS